MMIQQQEHLPLVLIGPVFPFKGGIAHYVTALYEVLRARCPVELHTYRSLYPSWLFPGRSEPDPSAGARRIPEARRDLSFLNPFSFFLLGRRLRRSKAPLVITWWTLAWMPHISLLLWGLGPRRHDAVFWCHNVLDHDGGRLPRLLTGLLLKRGRRFLVHTPAKREQLLTLVPGARIACADLPLVQLAPDLLTALPTVLERHPDTHLLVVGECWGHTRMHTEKRIRELGLLSAVRLIDRYVTNEQIPDVFRDADLVVLPYREATGSAVANLAIAMERPLVVTDAGSLPDCVQVGRTGYIARAGDPSDLAAKVILALDTAFSPEALAEIKISREAGWEALTAALESLTNITH